MSGTVLVTGTRLPIDQEWWWAELDRRAPDFVIVGDCPTGIDQATWDWCCNRGVKYRRYLADWDAFGLRAGPLRNGQACRHAARRAADGHRVRCLAVPRGEAKGTRDCMRQAQALGLKVEVL